MRFDCVDWVAKCGRNENDLNFFMTVPLMSNVHFSKAPTPLCSMSFHWMLLYICLSFGLVYVFYCLFFGTTVLHISSILVTLLYLYLASF